MVTTTRDLTEERERHMITLRALADAARHRNITTEEQIAAERAEMDLKRIDDALQEQRTWRGTREYRQAFGRWVLTGDAGAARALISGASVPANARALSTIDSGAGGFLVPVQTQPAMQMDSEIVATPMRQFSTVIETTRGGDYLQPYSTDTGSGRRLTQNTALSEQDASVAQLRLRAFTYVSDLVLVPNQLLQDGVNTAEWLSTVLTQRVWRATEPDFTVGTGANSPTGIATSATVAVTGGGQTSVTWDELLDAQDGVITPHKYSPSAGYMMHSDSLKLVKKLKSGEGHPLLKNEQRNGRRWDTIDGFVVVVNDNMSVMAAGAKSVLFGNLSLFLIRDATDVTVVRLGERYAPNMQTGFFAYQRTDGMLADPAGNGVVALQNAA